MKTPVFERGKPYACAWETEGMRGGGGKRFSSRLGSALPGTLVLVRCEEKAYDGCSHRYPIYERGSRKEDQCDAEVSTIARRDLRRNIDGEMTNRPANYIWSGKKGKGLKKLGNIWKTQGGCWSQKKSMILQSTSVRKKERRKRGGKKRGRGVAKKCLFNLKLDRGKLRTFAKCRR